MDAIVPLLVLAVAVWARLGRTVRRRDDVERAVTETVARLRRLAADAGVSTPPRAVPRAVASPRAPRAAAATPVAPAPSGVPPTSVVPAERVAPERVDARPLRRPVPAPRSSGRADGSPTPAPSAAPPAPGRAAVRRRRLDVRRDLVAAELLAVPVALRSGGDAWR